MKWYVSISFLLLSMTASWSVHATEYKTGAELSEAVSGINYDTDWEGVQNFRENAVPCEFSMYEYDGRYYLSIDEAMPGRDHEKLVEVFFRPNTRFVYEKRGTNQEYFWKWLGGDIRFISVELTYFDNENDDQKARIRLRTGKTGAACIVPAEF